jgi:hypothetical protein
MKKQHRKMFTATVLLLVATIAAPLFAGYCLNCEDIYCQSPCSFYPTNQPMKWSDCKECIVLFVFHACTACRWERYVCCRTVTPQPKDCGTPYCYPPYHWRLVGMDDMIGGFCSQNQYNEWECIRTW